MSDIPDAASPGRSHPTMRHVAALADGGWNQHPIWTPVIEAAGFRAAQSEVATAAPVTPAAWEYAQRWFARFSHLAAMTAGDRHAMEYLLRRFSGDIELEPGPPGPSGGHPRREPGTDLIHPPSVTRS
jgi:hypothetical protein